MPGIRDVDPPRSPREPRRHRSGARAERESGRGQGPRMASHIRRMRCTRRDTSQRRDRAGAGASKGSRSRTVKPAVRIVSTISFAIRSRRCRERRRPAARQPCCVRRRGVGAAGPRHRARGRAPSRASTGFCWKYRAGHAISAADRLNARIPSSATTSSASGSAARTSSRDVPWSKAVTRLRPLGARTRSWLGTVRLPA